jgi:hypothetical protein
LLTIDTTALEVIVSCFEKTTPAVLLIPVGLLQKEDDATFRVEG